MLGGGLNRLYILELPGSRAADINTRGPHLPPAAGRPLVRGCKGAGSRKAEVTSKGKGGGDKECSGSEKIGALHVGVG